MLAIHAPAPIASLEAAIDRMAYQELKHRLDSYRMIAKILEVA